MNVWIRDLGYGVLIAGMLSQSVQAGVSAPTPTVSGLLATYSHFSGEKLTFSKDSVHIIVSRSEALPISIQEITQIQNRLRAGDTVVFEYELSEQENREIRIRQLQNEIEKYEKVIADQKEIEEKLIKQGREKNWVRIGHAQNRTSFAKMKISLAESELNKLNKGMTLAIEKRVVELSLKQASETEVDQFLQERLHNSSRLTQARSVPATAIARVRRMARVRWFSVAGVLLGGVTVLTLLNDTESKATESRIQVFKPDLVRP